MTAPRGPDDLLVSEIFSAIQGEAALVGTRQVFLRLQGCNIRCAYCDQPEALERRAGPCRIERTPGRRDWSVVPSPLPIVEAVEAVTALWHALPHHSVSLTGGEPLMQAERLTVLLPALAAAGIPVMVETNGTLPRVLERLAEYVGHVSMDLKLPSVDGTRTDPAVQRRFLRVSLAAGLDTWVKIVLGPTTDRDELEAAVDMVAAEAGGSAGPPPVVYLQPVTPFGRVTAGPDPETVLALHETALRRYPSVRVVPQTHKAIGQL